MNYFLEKDIVLFDLHPNYDLKKKNITDEEKKLMNWRKKIGEEEKKDKKRRKIKKRKNSVEDCKKVRIENDGEKKEERLKNGKWKMVINQ